MKNLYDTVIIGSGLGGLSCAATLAKANKKVLVLEQHDLIGGCATCFKRKGMWVDVGLHEFDFGKPDRDMKHTIFSSLGLFKRLNLIKLPSAWTIKIKDKISKEPKEIRSITIPHGNTEQKLIEMFPHEKSGIQKYFKMINFQAFINRKFPYDMGFFELFFAPFTTLMFLKLNSLKNKKVGDVLDSLFKDSQLKRILNINLSYYHNNPYSFIWSFHAIPQSNYYTQGVYVKGGSQKLSDALVDVINECGGEVRIRSDVKKILTRNKTAYGVVYVDKKTGEEVLVHAKNVVANSDPRLTYKMLSDEHGNPLPEEVYQQDISKMKDFRANTSLVSLYMIFDKDLSQLYPEMDYSNFCLDSEYYNSDFNYKNDCVYEKPLEQRPFVFVNYSKIDSGLSDREDRFLGVICVASHSEEWGDEGEYGKESYKSKKEFLKKNLEERLESFFPGVMKHCIHSELATPLTIQRYTRTFGGVIYGFDQDKEGVEGRGSFRSESINNLYFASSFTFPGGGFTGAIISGYRTAKKMLDPKFLLRRISLNFLFGIVVLLVLISLFFLQRN